MLLTLAILKHLDKTDKKIDGKKEEETNEVSIYCKSLIPIIHALQLKKKKWPWIKYATHYLRLSSVMRQISKCYELRNILLVKSYK